ncbi:leucine zipper kinase [Planoprotostelium fungivorum]|uniref:non-specific serine/threonine protein kinase n=1 Tax=Planoprotostelium fungivorum TaxID=1890364 RepID=A0A2P6NZL0_9EUKA|nr:leucine zipper kinase [Planoprotostelium fungivorum]
MTSNDPRCGKLPRASLIPTCGRVRKCSRCQAGAQNKLFRDLRTQRQLVSAGNQRRLPHSIPSGSMPSTQLPRLVIATSGSTPNLPRMKEKKMRLQTLMSQSTDGFNFNREPSQNNLFTLPPLQRCATPRTETMKFSDYEVIKTIGSGSYGDVKLCQHRKTGQLVVIKKLVRNDSTISLIAAEIDAGKRLKHGNVIEFKCAFEDLTHSYIVMEYLQGTDLYNYLEKTDFTPGTEEDVRSLMRGIVSAVVYCHGKGIAHLDLKLENIMVTAPGTAKIIDFGLCDRSDVLCSRWVGSADYACPQILLHHSFMPEKADVWSLGVILYIMLFCVTPFDRADTARLLRKGRHPTMNKPEGWHTVSPAAQQLLQSMLEVDEKDRISLSGVMSHRFFRSTMRERNL